MSWSRLTSAQRRLRRAKYGRRIVEEKDYMDEIDLKRGAAFPAGGTSLGYYVDSDISTVERQRFFGDLGIRKLYRGSADFNMRNSYSRMTDFADALLGETDTYRAPLANSLDIAGFISGEPVYIEVSGRGYDDEDGSPIRTSQMWVTGTRKGRDLVVKAYEEAFRNEHVPMAQWWMKGPHGPQKQSVHIPPVNGDIQPCLYPDMRDPAGYMKAYLESSAPVLLMQGPPGTGKTSLLRHMILSNKLYANIVYDEQLLSNDSLFHSFLFDKDSDILIVEDADTILMGREDDGNKLMARFLNISDGLIKLPEKKIVFTTNLQDFSKVDSALLRPGRCYGVLHTRPLTVTEAQAVAKAYNLPVPIEKKEYTLADLFNQGQGGKRRSVGFLGG